MIDRSFPVVGIHSVRLTRRALTAALAGGGWLLAFESRLPALAQTASPSAIPLGNDAVSSVSVAAAVEVDRFPLDATPSPDGATVFFTATGAEGPAVYRVPAEGGAVVALASGAPFVASRGLAVSSDGRTVYVADSFASSSGAGGRVFALDVDGGDPVPVAGSDGTVPRALEIDVSSGTDHLIVAGVDPATGQPGILSLAAAGADAPAILATGRPLVAPDGVAVSEAGKVYVADRGPAGVATGGRVYEVEDGRVVEIAADFEAGDPAGIAPIAGDSVLAVSALDAATKTSVVLLIDVATGQTGVVTKGIGGNSGAGGLHRARETETLAWVDAPMGPIYIIKIAHT